MQLDSHFVQRLIFGGRQARRFTQDSPILPDVWRAFTDDPAGLHDLLLAPHIKASPGEIAHALRQAVDRGRDKDGPMADVAYNQFNLACTLRFDELVEHVLPRTHWWQTRILPIKEDLLGKLPTAKRLAELEDGPTSKTGEKRAEKTRKTIRSLADTFERLYRGPSAGEEKGQDRAPVEIHGQKLMLLYWMATLVGALLWAQRPSSKRDQPVRPSFEEIVRSLVRLHDMWKGKGKVPIEGRIWSVHRNRRASASIADSVRTVKADAARLLFDVRCEGITWAVLDSGIDASHPAFFDDEGDPEKDAAVAADDELA